MQSGGSAAGGLVGGFIALAIAVFMLAAMWRVYTKAGQPGWAVIIPIYNTIVLLRIAGKQWWWFLLMLVPLVNIVVVILAYAGVATNFGKGGGFTLGLLFLPFIFFPILAFGSATYQPMGMQPIGQMVRA
jgi:hypothetical protein